MAGIIKMTKSLKKEREQTYLPNEFSLFTKLLQEMLLHGLTTLGVIDIGAGVLAIP